MSNNLNEEISLFLQDPAYLDENQKIYSTLFLLRRDVSLCFGYSPNDKKKIEFEALFPATIAVLAGIDLLAKFVFLDSSKVGDRFKDFVAKYIDNNFCEEIYQLRNSLLHSFGLYSESKKGKVYHFILARGQENLINQISEKSYSVDIEILWAKFENSVNEYHKELKASGELQDNFSAMFPKYGSIELNKGYKNHV